MLDKASTSINLCQSCKKKKKRQNFWVALVAVLILSPIVAGVIVGLFATLIKFFQICMHWIGL